MEAEYDKLKVKGPAIFVLDAGRLSSGYQYENDGGKCHSMLGCGASKKFVWIDVNAGPLEYGPLHRFGGFLKNVFEKSVVDGLVNGVGKAVNYGSRQMRWLQSGQVGNYVLLMVLSMVLIFIVQFFLRK